jgi:hypothetical protein
MIDDDASPNRTSRIWRRERAIRATRARVTQLEIETHWIKSDLARLESENEADLAVELTHELHGKGVSAERPAPASSEAVATQQASKAHRVNLAPRRRVSTEHQVASPAPESFKANPSPPRLRAEAIQPVAKRRRKKRSSAWVASLGVHALVLLLLAPMTFVIITNEPLPLFASMFEFEGPPTDELGAAPIELVSFDEFEMPSELENAAPDLAEGVVDGLIPAETELAGEAMTNVGQLNTLPTDVGTLMAGGGRGKQGLAGGGGGRGAAGDEARLGKTSFFGTPARANRVVFLVDNSASMKQGRMETTLFELARSIEQLGEKQEFYVIFYSDQAYPMFYPQSEMKAVAATRENKQRLFQWLHTVELCVGGALLKAVDLADSLEPQVVYLLSDGDISGTKTMEQLSQAHDRKFAIHTLGMGVKKPQDAQNLAIIAQANRGTFQMVGTLPAAVQAAKARPIRSNSWGTAWGQGGLAGGR